MKCASCEQNQIYSGFAEAEYLRHSQSTIFLCQSAAGGGCVGRLWRLRAAALRVLTEERIFRNCILADLRSAGSHCKNSGSSDGSGASARSDRAKSEVFRDRSASAGGDTRYFSRCLIFWCFWIKPKAQKKKIHDRRNRFFGKNSDAKIGCTVSAGRSLRNTSTAADLRGRRLRPARRKGAATPDSGRAADRTEETSAGKRRER